MASRHYPPLAERFWSKVNKHGPTLITKLGPCWLWTGATDKNGYGQMWYNGAQCKAHRVAWLLVTNEWPEPFGLHRCDNPSCVRFSHLFQGTPKDNTMDMIKKGRRCSARKLNAKQVLNIRKVLARGERGSVAALARLYIVSKANISNIKHGKIWKGCK